MPNAFSNGGPAVRTPGRPPSSRRSATHKFFSVTLHWHQEVNPSIDRDVKLGVLTAEPVGEPVTRCHRMLTARKINGKPRRTVEMPLLNKRAVRERLASDLRLTRNCAESRTICVCLRHVGNCWL